MNSPAPLWLTVPILVFVGLVTVARWRLVDDTHPDRLVNWALTWALIGVACEEAGKGTEYAEVTYRVFLACGMVSLVKVYGLAALFDGGDARVAAQRQRTYDVFAAIGAVIVMVTGRPADPAEAGFAVRTIVLSLVFSAPLVASSIHVARACVREVRVAGAAPRERLTYGALLVAAVFWIYTAIVSAVKVFGGGASETPGAYWSVSSCLIFLLVTSMPLIALIKVLFARGGWDRVSRVDRRLRPLWQELTAVVPEVVLIERQGTDPESRLYRMMVEIHDALQHLRQYIPEDEPLEGHAGGFADQIARAARVKASGGLARPAAVTSDAPHTRDRDMAAEFEHLLALARAWPRAQARALSAAPATR
ncbi:MAB_1171c family putative transporter [Nocardia sp. NPDC051832]|uniref:MAB_1171c family putative transporter n=1 Tax=Nocardia sp. NPDC051832 TaxID=3155673 RepID=UPI003444A47D